MPGVPRIRDLKSVIIGLPAFAAAEEQMLPAAAPADEPGSPAVLGRGAALSLGPRGPGHPPPARSSAAM